MCFRPAGADNGPNTCPECGKVIQSMGGMVMKKCPFCKADFTKYLEDNGADVGKINASGAPNTPGAPKAPGAPGMPKAPGAPRPPAA